jgi:pantoate--beta-alanine ligase
MEIIHRLSHMSAISAKLLAGDVHIGLVPTMGVIHPGHVGLIETARKMTDLVVVSIFVCRNQFDGKEEYLNYPRDITKDVDLLTRLRVDYVFSPSEEEMFPPDFATYVEIERFGEKLHGRQQSGYFRGITTTTLKLIHIVRPGFLFLGLKDALQGGILRKMIKDLNLGTEVVVTPVARHPSGLAFGTRNYFLSEAEKAAAPVLYRSLKAAEEAVASGERHAKKVLQEIKRVLEQEPMASPEYAFIADPETLEPVSRIEDKVLIGVGAKIGSTHLNDSLLAEIPTEPS